MTHARYHLILDEKYTSFANLGLFFFAFYIVATKMCYPIFSLGPDALDR